MGPERIGTTKITLVGAGGMAFGPTMVNDVLHTPALAGAELVLHDVDAARLERAATFAHRLNASNGSPIRLLSTTDPAAALDGAAYVISSAEFGRFAYRRQDYEIPNAYGARQINGENGGPGAVFHTLRSVTNTLSICDAMSRHCPEAFLINLSNPLSRVALAINRHTAIRNVSMCHEMPNGIYRLAKLMRIDHRRIEATAAGINHFTFFSAMRDRQTGEDLLDRIRRMFERPIFDYPPWTVAAARASQRLGPVAALADELYMPLVVHLVREYGIVPTSIDSHIGEYLAFTPEVARWYPARVDVMERFSRFTESLSAWAGRTRAPLPFERVGRSNEEVIPIIAAMHSGAAAELMAVNTVNRGFIPDLPDGTIVEVSATVDANGVSPHEHPPLGEPVRAWTLAQLPLWDLLVRSVVERDPAPALEALRADPLSPADPAACEAMFREMLRRQAEHLPF